MMITLTGACINLPNERDTRYLMRMRAPDVKHTISLSDIWGPVKRPLHQIHGSCGKSWDDGQ